MYQAKLILSPTPVTSAILPERSMGIIRRGSCCSFGRFGVPGVSGVYFVPLATNTRHTKPTETLLNETARGQLVRGPFYQLPSASPTPIAAPSAVVLRLAFPHTHLADARRVLRHNVPGN